jgi:hypothetical protein
MFDNFDDPKTQLLMALGAGLLGGAPGQRKNFGADLGHGLQSGLLAYQGARAVNARDQEEAQQRKMREMQIAEMQRAGQERSAMQAAAQRNFTPGMPQMQPTDQEMPSGPTGPGAFNPQDYARDIMSINPMAGMELQAKLAAMGAKERVKVDAGQTVGTYVNGKFVPDYSAPDKPPAGFMRDAKGNLVGDRGYIDAQKEIRAAGKTQISIDNKQEGAFATAFGKQNAEDYGALMKGDMLASSKLNKLGRLESLLDSSGKTGKLTPTTMELKAVADSLGFKVDPKLPYQQAAGALANEMALELRNPSGGAGMPGALSDKDREFLTNMVPNLAKTPGGNKLLLETHKKVAQRDKEVAKLAREYKQKNGKFDEGFYQVLSEHAARNPLFSKAEAPKEINWKDLQ